MDSLIEEAWHHYHRAEDIPFVVRPSIPILFFGDSQRYARSQLKVVTVGLNPSRIEFPVDDSFRRFRQAQHVYPGILSGLFYTQYLAALNDYFRTYPYRQWFASFEPLLNGMEVSYYDGWPNAALHTDLCSPLATDPTWSRLRDGRTSLALKGSQLWHRLTRLLSPDVVLISVARDYMATIDFPLLRDWETIYTIERANPYRVEAREVEVTGGKSTVFIFGQAANTPFGTVSNQDKEDIGRCIGEYVRGR